MVMRFAVKLSLLALCVTNAFGAKLFNGEGDLPGTQRIKAPIEIVKSFDDKFITTPPKSAYDVYEVTERFKNAKEVQLNVTAAKEESQSCIQFDYYVYLHETLRHDTGLKLVSIDSITGESQTRFARYGRNGDVWRTASLSVPGEKGQFLQYKALLEDFDGRESVATVSFTQPRYDESKAACAMLPYNSDFEDDIITWEADIRTVHDVTTETGDHTSDSVYGKVAYLGKGSRMALKNSLKKGAAKCLSFWYYQMPHDIITEVHRPFAVHLNGKTFWKSSSLIPTFHSWTRVTVPLDLTSERNHFTIEAESLKADIKTTMIIDDIEFTEQACPEPVSCKFQGSICDWTPSYSDGFGSWQLGQGRVEKVVEEYKKGFLPRTDSSIYTDFTRRSSLDHSPIHIRSGLLPNDGEEYCATIDIIHNRVAARDSFSLNLIEEKGVSSDNRPLKELWKLDITKAAAADKGQYHAETHQVVVPGSQLPRRLVFSASGDTETSRFAVKEIKVTKGSCQTFVKSALPRETLVVADEFMKNSIDNVQRIIDLIKIEDPVKDACVKLMTEMKSAGQQIKQNL